MTDTTSTHYPEPEGRSASTRSDSARNGNTITCIICQAGYAPAQTYEYLLQAPRVALESAFMSMCHFCFRCRRPACPSCWDYVHGVCGACALEARLPFRSPSTPLQGVLFPPIRQAQVRNKRAPQTRLICTRPGKFQTIVSSDSVETIATEVISPQTKIPGATPDPKVTEHPSPERIPLSSTRPIAPPTKVNIDEIVTRPEPPDRIDIDEIATRPEPHNRIDIDEITEIATKPEPRNSIPEIASRPGRRRSIRSQIERVIISILLALLLVIVALIVLASLSASTNTIILKITHIDIRVEIAYILQLIRQVFS